MYQRSFVQSIGRGTEHSTLLLEDNMGAIKLSDGGYYRTRRRTKLMNVKCHYAREKVEGGTI